MTGKIRDQRRGRRSSVARLRAAFYSRAGESAARYGIRFERVLLHLWRARQHNARLRLGSVSCMEDLVHAVACDAGDGLAWSDLAERYERALVRRCRTVQDEIESTLLVRRVFAALRRRDIGSDEGTLSSMGSYAGSKPLRNWLADRVNAMRARESLPHSAWAEKPSPPLLGRRLKNGTFDQAVSIDAWIAPVPLRFVPPEPA